MMRDLNRSHADTPRTSMNQNSFAFAQSCNVPQRVPRCHEDDWQGRRFLERKMFGNASHVANARDRLCCEAENREAKNAIAGPDMSNIRSNGYYNARNFVTEDARIGRFAGIKSECFEYVTEIHS